MITESSKGMRVMLLALLSGLVAAVVAVVAPPASAADFTQQGTIEAFIGANLVNVQGYPANSTVTIEVLRNGVLVGKVTGTTDDEGFAEFNHVGGGQVSEGGDCFEPPETPDIVAGDVIQTKNAAGDITGSAVVRDVAVNFDTITNVNAGTITVSGHAISHEPDAPIVPEQDVLELRLNKGSADVWDSNARKDLRVDIGKQVQDDGSWTRTLNVGTQDARDWQDNPGEVFLEWSEAAVGEEEALPPAIFVADEGEGPLPGCPPLNGETAPPEEEDPPVEEPAGELKVQTDLTGDASGKAQFERKGAEQRFAVELKNGPVNEALTILIDGVAAGEQLSLNNRGEGKLQTTDTGDAVINGIAQGSVIELRDSNGAPVASGTLE